MTILAAVESSRIDLWLKLACVFKHRSDAADACQGGHVRVNEKRVKPASPVKVSDVVELTGDRYRRLVVLRLPEKHISRAEARAMYRDETPQQPREIKVRIAVRDRGAGRPTKKQRREIDRWKR